MGWETGTGQCEVLALKGSYKDLYLMFIYLPCLNSQSHALWNRYSQLKHSEWKTLIFI